MRAKITTPRFILAAAASGSGKTTVAMGLAALLSARMSVACFKVGPDYIDPAYVGAGAKTVASNLDGWLLSELNVKDLFCRRSAGADVVVVEGVMGLFDGRGIGDAGSTAQIAKLLKIPVILVVDASGAGRSLAALTAGFKNFDPDVQIAGVVLNRVGGERHARLAKEPIELEAGVPVLGWLERNEDLTMASRHLGLAQGTAAELERAAAGIARELERNLDVDRLLAIARTAPNLQFDTEERALPCGEKVKIGVARDDAFSFYYRENFETLEALGARTVFFSPLRDKGLPQGVRGLYFGGGWPELHARTLAGNKSMLCSIRDAGEAGMPIYAECGGLTYLTRSISYDGHAWSMVGLLPASAKVMEKRQGLGYREARFHSETIMGGPGMAVRGHEFHWSVVEKDEKVVGPPSAGGFTDAYVYENGAREGFASKNVLASYLHVNWLGQPHLAEAFVDACREEVYLVR